MTGCPASVGAVDLVPAWGGMILCAGFTAECWFLGCEGRSLRWEGGLSVGFLPQREVLLTTAYEDVFAWRGPGELLWRAPFGVPAGFGAFSIGNRVFVSAFDGGRAYEVDGSSVRPLGRWAPGSEHVAGCGLLGRHVLAARERSVEIYATEC